ncbi:hypothetical protein HGRIS_011686 [Hohenbuehelia grisea]|uniref:Protein kinase domain-containing protein n=1 Tax=Hohenbuehelia grisea TaxID=104357 RepID=A0ABR3JXK4_9AGAR
MPGMPAPSSQHPPVGTLIDNGSLRLVEILGVGGYGVVYRAIDTGSLRPQTYAVKCLLHTQVSRKRQAHIQEIALHQISSAHPNVVTLHRVIEEPHCTFIIMEFASAGDLFSQILHKCRYLGDDYIIKRVFLQLLDAVEYCHSLGIYHRDLKPENVLCFDDGMRVAITDFGLATTDKVSEAFRTGSIYHMSPECYGEEFAPSGVYSPMQNDIWSLGIVLINLATGRNPWRSASSDDPTFHAYTRDPDHFLPSVLPLSDEANAILTRMLELSPRKRMPISEIREVIEDIETFYADDAVFEGSMARCSWEAGIDLDAASTMKDEVSNSSSDSHNADSIVDVQTPQSSDLKSHWSKESTSDIVFAKQTTSYDSAFSGHWRGHLSNSDPWAIQSEASSASGHAVTDIHLSEHPRTPPHPHSELGPYHAYDPSSLPATPTNFDATFAHHDDPKRSLKIETGYRAPLYYNGGASFSTMASSVMHTAIDAYDSSIFLATPASAVMKSPEAEYAHINVDDHEMQSPSSWHFASSEETEPSLYSTTPSTFGNASMMCEDSPFAEPTGISFWSDYATPLPGPNERLSQPPPPLFSPMTDTSCFSAPSRPPRKRHDSLFRAAYLFNPIKFFPRANSPSPSPTPGSSRTPSPNACTAFSFETHAAPGAFLQKPPLAHGRRSSDPLPSFPAGPSRAESLVDVWCAFPSPRSKAQTAFAPQERAGGRGREARERSPRRWFSPARLFSGSGSP